MDAAFGVPAMAGSSTLAARSDNASGLGRGDTQSWRTTAEGIVPNSSDRSFHSRYSSLRSVSSPATLAYPVGPSGVL